jgi:integrase
MSKIRGHGEGSIYKRKDGLWVAQIYAQGTKLYRYARTQREARDWLQETRNQMQSGLNLSSAHITLNQFLQQWLESHKASIRPNTVQQYSYIVNHHLLPGIGRIRLKDLRPDHIQALYNSSLRDGKSQRTVQMMHAVLNHALNQALKWGLIGRNPAQGTSRPKFRRKEMKTLNGSQVQDLLQAVRGSRFEALYLLAVSTGMREGELLGLKWGDIDWETRRLKVQRQLQRLKESGLVFSEPKSRAGIRSVVLSRIVVSRLRSHRVIQAYERLFAGNRWKENDLIFPTTIGTAWEPRNLYRHFKTVLAQAGLPDIRFHDLRHTAATLMLQQGTHPKVVQERLGHADISLTLNTYSHVLPDIQEEAAEKFDLLLIAHEPNSKSEHPLIIDADS